MTNSKKMPAFYIKAETPEFWTLYDLVLWVSAKVLPQEAFRMEIPSRRSMEFLFDNTEDFGKFLAPEWLEPAQTDILGIGHDPDWINLLRELDGEAPLYSPEYHQRRIETWRSLSAEDKMRYANSLAEPENAVQLAEEHAEYKSSWLINFDDAMDEARTRIFLALKSGELKAVGIPAKLVQNDDGLDEYSQALGSLDRAISDDDFSSFLEPIPENWWLLRRVNWNASELREKNDVYIGVQIESCRALEVFPPTANKQVTVFEYGDVLVSNEPDAVSVKPTQRRKPAGRPPKKWDAISLRIAEIIQRDGGLPSKQDALAQEICDWYKSTFDEAIGVSTVKAKLTPYYSSNHF